jgi:hypothetical protein
MANVNLYQFPQVIQVSKPNAVSVATVINRTDFNAFKHVDNDVEFLIKDWDNKPVNLTNLTVTIYIVDQQAQKLMSITNPVLTIVNPTRGHCRLTLLKQDTAEWVAGYFGYSISVTDANGKETMLYVDKSRVVQGYFEFQEGPLPQPQKAVVLTPDAFTAQSWGTDTSISSYLVAQEYPGAAQSDNRSGLQTIAVYANNFTGTLWVQASLENSPPNDDSQWFDVTLNTGDTSFNFTNFTGIKHFSFVGSYMWLRFIQYVSPVNNNGSISQVLLKN